MEFAYIYYFQYIFEVELRKERYKFVEKKIADIIGEEYKEWGTKLVWNQNDVIYIDSQTGSGKSYFICHCLLELAILRQCRILYLVNRKVLQEQIQKEVDDAIREYTVKNGILYTTAYNITIMSYQALEEMIERNGFPWIIGFLAQYAYLVADEVHYFLQDSTYNTNTALSFEAIMSQVGLVRIFMSATIKDIKAVIESKRREMHTSQYGPNVPLREAMEYSLEQNYQHIKLKFFTDFVSLASIIEQDSKKWLVVVDGIEKGKKILKELRKRDVNAVFIDAEYEKESVSYETVREIVDEKKFDCRVLISTIVLDNGLTIKDEALRNLVIVADTEVEFKQILGRKRLLDNEGNVNVYIMRREQSEFRYRLMLVENHLKFVAGHDRYMNNYMNNFGTNHINNFAQLSNISTKYLITSVLKNERAYECAKHVLYFFDGRLAINLLANKQYSILRENYKKILERYEKEGEDAFFKCQAEWIGLNNIDTELEEYKNDQTDHRRAEVISKIEAIADQGMNREEYILKRETFRKSLYDLFEAFVKNIDPEIEDPRHNSIIKDLKRNDRATAKDSFDYVMKCLGLPYSLQTQHTKPEQYIICRLDESEE